jgi:hypothetical protein
MLIEERSLRTGVKAGEAIKTRGETQPTQRFLHATAYRRNKHTAEKRGRQTV